MRFISGISIFNGKEFLPEGAALVLEKNVLKDIIRSAEVDSGRVERFDGTLAPGFVNAHCHLELSHLRGKIIEGGGLPRFGKSVIEYREHLRDGEAREHLAEAEKEMFANGIVAVGDISNTVLSFDQKSGAKLYYHTFIELLGFNPATRKTVFESGKALLRELDERGLSGSLCPHAPYSVSLELMRDISDYNVDHNLPQTIHNQECTDESDFLLGKKSGFTELYQSIGYDLSWHKPPGISGPEYYAQSLSGPPTILVHNTYTAKADLVFTNALTAWWCFCPSANLYIESKLPQFEIFRDLREQVCIGTDSLASNNVLDLAREASQILKETDVFTKTDLLRAMTFNGAAALGLAEKYGSLNVGTSPGLNLVDTGGNEIRLIKKII